MDQATLDRLNAADDPEAWETPAGFNYWKEVGAIGRVKPDLEKVSGLSFDLERQIQDAAFFGYLFTTLPGSDQTHLSIRFSSFGKMVTVITNPNDVPTPSNLLHKLVEVLEQHDYVYVDAQSLQELYTGCLAGFQSAFGDRPPTWWDRFFDYQ